MAEPRPRNWKAMRADRVLAMAENRFGKRFASKEAAIAELVKLPAREQRSLKKVAVSKAERARRSAASDRMIAGMSARPKPREAIDAARAMSAQYLSAASKLADEHPGIASIKTRIARTAEAQAIGAEMKIASRVAKGQSTRAAKETKPMVPIPERLKGLKRAQLAAVARDVGGISINSKTTAAQLRAQINKRIAEQARYEAKNAVARQANAWGADPLAQRFDRGKVSAAAGKGRGAMESKINAAIDKVSADAPVKGKTAAVSGQPPLRHRKTSRAPKSNPALVQDLAAKVNVALTGGDADKLKSTLAEVKAAKLSKADSHALAKSLGVNYVAPSASGATARKAVERSIRTTLTDFVKSAAVKKIPLAAVMPVLAVAAAATAFSDSSHAGDGTAEATKQAAKAAGDVVSFGAVGAHDKAKARGAGDVEAVATGAAVGAINFATFGVAEMANEALADKGGVSGVISDTVTKAASKVGELFGWSDAARAASAEARGAAAPGTVDVSAVGRDLARELFGGTAHAASDAPVANGGEDPSLAAKLGGTVVGGLGGAMVLIGRETIKERGYDYHGSKVSAGTKAFRVAKGAGTIGAGLALVALGVGISTSRGGKSAQDGKSFLNDAAERKAAEVRKPVAPTPVVAAAAQRRSDGQTEGYMRRGRNGQTVQVKAYRTPTR